VRVSSTYAFEGQVITIYANITYPNGTEVKYGMYSATVYPLSLSGLYPLISQVFETPLWYNPRLGLWVGNVTLPSQYSLGSLTYLGGNLYFSSPYGVLVTGTSADGYPTPSSLSTQYTLYVIPYTMLNGATLSGIKAYHMALINDTLIGGVYVDSILINDTLIGNVTLVNCNASELTVINSHLLLVSSSIGRVRAINSTVELFSSRVGELDLSSSTYVNENSVISSIYPKPPIVIINSPVNGTSLTGLVTVNFTVIGNDVLNVSLYLNNHVLIAFTGNGTFTYTLNTTDYPDGTYELSVVAVQSSGAVASSSVEVNLANELLSLSGGLSRLTGELASNATAMRKALVELNSNLTMIEILLLVSLALSAAALAWFAASRVKST
jgi:Predicted protease